MFVFVFCDSCLICEKVNIQPRSHDEIAGNLLSEVNDPNSNYSQLVAAGDIQVVLSYTYAKASLINIPPDQVCLLRSLYVIRLKITYRLRNRQKWETDFLVYWDK